MEQINDAILSSFILRYSDPSLYYPWSRLKNVIKKKIIEVACSRLYFFDNAARCSFEGQNQLIL